VDSRDPRNEACRPRVALRSWKELFVADLIYKVIAFVILAPLAGFLFRLLLAASGRSVLADQDILVFLLKPLGLMALAAGGAVWMAIFALEHVALMRILWDAFCHRPANIRLALQLAVVQAWPVLRLAGRAVAILALTAAPFLALAGLVYIVLLSRYDIGYYLAERPPAFWVAAIATGGALVILGALILRLLVRWSFALPMMMFEGASATDALRLSRKRTAGRQRTLALWLVGWALATLSVSALATGAIGFLGHLFLPSTPGPLWVLVLSVGAMLVIWFLVNLVVTLLGTISLAFVIVRLYWELGHRGGTDSVSDKSAASNHCRFILRLSGRGVRVAGLAAALVAGTAGAVAVGSVKLEDRTQIVAHRGASGAAPENTLAAIERAILDGSDWVEVDVQETADGHVAVIHDRDFQRVAGTGLRVSEATIEDLGRLDVGSWFAPKFRDERVPTLGQVLALCKNKAGVNIELKYYGQNRRLEQRVVELVEAHEMASQVMVMSLKYDGVQEMRLLRPQWHYGYLAAVTLTDPIRVEANFLAVNTKRATWRFVRAAHRRGKDVYVWTVNDPVTMSTLMGRGVDGIITDEPARARSVLAQRARMSSVERLLVQLAVFLGAGRDSHLNLDEI